MRVGGRSQFVAIACAFVTLLAIAPQARASHPFDEQSTLLRGLRGGIAVYKHKFGEYPRTDAQGTWYEKLTRADLDYESFGTTPNGEYPLDYYGHPIVYRSPSAATGGKIVVRSVGKNGIDEQGQGDDWDILYGPNLGYWYKQDWPAARRRAVICGALALVGVTLILWFVRRWSVRIAAVSLYVGVLAAVVLPWGFDSGLQYSSASIDPDWLQAVASGGAFFIFISLCISAGLVLDYVALHALRRREAQRYPEGRCRHCNYDLRGLKPRGVRCCPECGTPFT